MRTHPPCLLALLLTALLVHGCDEGEGACRCVGELEGSGRVDVACGESTCVGGVGLRCTDERSVVLEPSACGICGDGTCSGTEDVATCPGDCDVPDGGGASVPMFGLCTSDSACMPELRCATTFPTAFCTHECTSDAQCESGTCLNEICVPPCGSGALDCDAYGGACAPDGAGGFCLPACEATGIDTTTCSEGLVCDRWWSECWSVPQSDGPDIGAPCTRNDQCRTGLCYPEVRGGRPSGYVGGMCLGLTRSPGPGAPSEQGGCPPGSVTEVGQREGDAAYCYPACSTNDECRPGYFCGPTPSMRRYCTPIDCDVAGVPACPAGTTCQTASGVRRCVACVPSCSGRACGPDACGGSCGTCSGALEVCNEARGACECTGELDTELCAAAGAECGMLSATDRCGVTRSASCGACVAPDACGAVTANQCDCVGESDAVLCTAAGAMCGELATIDRCGASRSVSCGGCTAPAECGALVANQCACIGEEADALCAARGAECGALSATDRCGVGRSLSCGSCTLPETCAGAGVANACGICTPACTGRVCGADGCGGSCGSCGSGQRCNASGACEVIPCDPVADTLCGTGLKCDWTGSATACVAEGTGRAGDSCFNTTHCASQYACTGEGICREYCTASSHCSSGRCALDATGTPYGLCSRPCDPTYDASRSGTTGCPDFGDCRLLDSGRATEFTDCGTAGIRGDGSSCTEGAQCDGGFACAGGRCRRICTRGTSCTTGTCASVSGWTTYGVCP